MLKIILTIELVILAALLGWNLAHVFRYLYSRFTLPPRLRLLIIRILAMLRGVDLSHLSDEQLQEKISLANIRSHMSFFGYDLSHLSDDEIKERVARLSQSFASSGLSSEQAVIAASRFSELARASMSSIERNA